MKKILAIALAMVMVLACSVAVFAAETVVYEFDSSVTLGQNLESSVIDGSGLALPDDSDGVGARLATNWVGGGTVYNAVLEAIKTEGAVVKLTFTGEITSVGFQTENGGMEFTDITDVTEVDGKKVAIIPCADIVANAPVAVANDNVGWGNFMITHGSDAVVYGFAIVTGYEAGAAAPADPEPAPAADPEPAPAADPEPAPAPAPSTNTAPATGLALAVVPAVVAMAAVAVSKKR